jgi:hypothetical protein
LTRVGTLGVTLIAFIGLGSHAANGSEPGPRAAGGVRLIEAMESSPATVVGSFESTRALDARSHAAILRVETAVAGEIEPGSRLSLAWEELAASRTPRFAAGDRVLVVLAPLPGASIWLTRLPRAAERQATMTVALAGKAFLRSPSPASATLLAHYLTLAPLARGGAPGTGYLCEIAAGAEIPLAIDAVARLDARSDLDAQLGPKSAARLVAALLRTDASEALRAGVVALVERHRLESMRAALTVVASQPEAPAVAFEALAGLDGLAPELTARLLADAASDRRAVGARHAEGASAYAELRELLAEDPAPEVRAAALERLVELEGSDAVSAIANALSDPEPSVRILASRRLAALGAPAVTELRRVVEGNDLEAARAAIAGLAFAGRPEAMEALRDFAANHSDESIRAFARIALGGDIGHNHD